VEGFEGTHGLEAHQLHAYAVKELDLLDILRGHSHFLSSSGVESADLVLIQHRTRFLAYESLGAPQRLVVFSIDFHRVRLLCGEDRGVESQSHLGLGGDTEQALTLSPLPELFLPDSFQQLSNSILCAFYLEHLSKIFIILHHDDICVESLHIEDRSLLLRLGHSKELYVHPQTTQIICALL